MGIEVFMMTRGNKPIALAIAKRVGIEAANFWANMSPKGKASVISEIIEWENAVAMVRFVLRFACYAGKLILSYPGWRRNQWLSGPS